MAREFLSNSYRNIDLKLGGNLSRIGLVAAITASTGGVGCGASTNSLNSETKPVATATQTSTPLPTETPVPATATPKPIDTPTPMPAEQLLNPQSELLKNNGVYSGYLITEGDEIKKGKFLAYRVSETQIVTSYALAEDYTGNPGNSIRTIGYRLLKAPDISKNFVLVPNGTKDTLSFSIENSSLIVKLSTTIGPGPLLKMRVPSMTYVGDGTTTYLNTLSSSIDEIKLHFTNQRILEDAEKSLKITLP